MNSITFKKEALDRAWHAKFVTFVVTLFVVGIGTFMLSTLICILFPIQPEGRDEFYISLLLGIMIGLGIASLTSRFMAGEIAYKVGMRPTNDEMRIYLLERRTKLEKEAKENQKRLIAIDSELSDIGHELEQCMPVAGA